MTKKTCTCSFRVRGKNHLNGPHHQQDKKKAEILAEEAAKKKSI